jgi:AraC family transcriptional regulator
MPEGDVGVQEVGGGEYAITTHRGPYENVAQTIARLCGEWLPASGREPRSAPVLAIFRNFPPDTPPEDLLTDIYLPLE